MRPLPIRQILVLRTEMRRKRNNRFAKLRERGAHLEGENISGQIGGGGLSMDYLLVKK